MTVETLTRPRERPPVRRWASSSTASVVAPVVLAVLLTVWRYGAKPLWRDEVYTLVTAGRPLTSMLALLEVRDAGLLGYYALMNPWIAVSDAPAWLRLPAALATPVLVGLSALLGRRVGGPPVALVSGVLVALAPGVVGHAQEARPYALVLAATALTALLLLRSTDGPRGVRWVVLSGVAVLAVALHPLVAVPAVGGLFAATWLRPGRAPRRWVVAAAVPAAALGLALVAVGARQAIDNPPAPATPAEYLTFWRIVTWHPALGAGFLALVVAGTVLLRRRRREVALLLAWAVAPVAAVTVLGLSGSYFNARYATAAVPALCVLAAVGASAAARVAAARWAPHWTPWSVAAVLVAVLVTQAPAALADRAAPYYFDDGPSAAQEVAAGAVAGDAVVYAGPVARPLVAPHLPYGLESGGRLDDVLLVAAPQRSDTLGGLELRGRQRTDAVARYPRVWLVGTRATATTDLPREARNAEVAVAGRSLVSRHDHGWVRVELWAAPGAPGTP